MELLTCPLFKHAECTPTQVALQIEDQSWTYHQLNQIVNSLCLQLQAQDIREGSRVAFIATTTLPTILLFPALFRLKAIACPLSTRIPPEQISSHLDRLKSSHFVYPDRYSLNPSPSKKVPLLSADSLATFLFTSGSSGIPKIACHSFANHYYNALGSLESLKLHSDSRYLLSLPLFHVGGIAILFRCWLSGSRIVLSSLPLLDTLKVHPLTHLSLVPTHLYRLLQAKLPPSPSLQCLLLGGAPSSSQLLLSASKAHWPVHTTYGLTEASSMVTLQTVLPFREIQVINSEILIRGKTLFQGYWDSAQESISKHTQDGWFATKDLGVIHPDGRLEIIGRKDRQFISGGENIQPEEIEKALCTLPGIIAAYVTSTPDEEFGRRPIAFIEDVSGKHTLETIRQGLKPQLPSFKHPIHLAPLSSLQTSNMKFL